MATYWRRKCNKCGYQVSGRTTSYNGATVGPPLTKCPKCENIQIVSSHREWIQLSPRQKFSYVFHQSFASELIMLLCFSVGPMSSLWIKDKIILVILTIICGVIGVFLGYLYNVRMKSFLNAYAYSLWRTDNEQYRKALSIPEENVKNTDIPFYKPGEKAIEEINLIRQKEHRDSMYFSSFDEI